MKETITLDNFLQMLRHWESRAGNEGGRYWLGAVIEHVESNREALLAGISDNGPLEYKELHSIEGKGCPNCRHGVVMDVFCYHPDLPESESHVNEKCESSEYGMWEAQAGRRGVLRFKHIDGYWRLMNHVNMPVLCLCDPDGNVGEWISYHKAGCESLAKDLNLTAEFVEDGADESN